MHRIPAALFAQRSYLTMTALLAMCCLGLPLHAATPRTGSVVIVVSQDKGSPNLNKPIKRIVSRILGKKTKIIPFKLYAEAAKSAGIKPRDTSDLQQVAELGKSIDTDFVLVIHASRHPKADAKPVPKRKKIRFAHVSLIRSLDGDVVFSKIYRLKKKRLKPKQAKKMAKLLQEQIATATEALAQAEEQQAASDEADDQAEETDEGTDTSQAEGSSDEADDDEADDDAPRISRRPDPKRYALRVHLGAGLQQRSGKLVGTQDTTVNFSREGEPVPRYLATALQLEVFPFNFIGDYGYLGGLGVHADVLIGFAESQTALASAETLSATSTVMNIKGGLSYRLPWKHSELWPDTHFRAGMQYYNFPVAQNLKNPFPGITSLAPYVEVDFRIPIYGYATVVLGGGVFIPLMLQGDAKWIGESYSSSMGYRAHGGVIVPLKKYGVPIEIALSVAYDGSAAQYSGGSSLKHPEGTPLTVTDAKYSESHLDFIATVGYVM